MTESSLLSRFVSILTSKVAALLTTIITTPVIIRLLSPSEYGDYSFVMSIFAILTSLVGAGVFNGARKFISEDRSQSNWRQEVFSFYFWTGLLIASATSILLVFLINLNTIQHTLNLQMNLILFYLLGVLLIVNQLFSVCRGALMAGSHEHLSEPLNSGKILVFSVFGIILAYFSLGVLGLLVARILSIISVLLLAILVIRQKMNLSIIYNPVASAYHELLAFNWQSIVFSVLVYSLYHVDIVLLRLYTSGETTAYYRAALIIAEFIIFVPQAIQMLMVQSSSNLWSEGSIEKVNSILSQVTRLNIMLVLIMAIGLLFLADEFVVIYYGVEYLESIQPLKLLLPGVIGLAISRPIFATGQGKGNLRPLILASGAAAIVNLLLNLILIPRYGSIGAAISTSIGYGLMLVFHLLAARSIGISLQNLRLLPIVAASVMSSVVLYYSTNQIDGLVSLLIIPPIVFSLYLIIIYFLGGFSDEELTYISDLAEKILK